MGAVAKYRVFLSVCEDISGTTHAISTNFFVHVAHVRGWVLTLTSMLMIGSVGEVTC